MDQPFLGFSDGNSESEAYLRAFERFRKVLIPVVALDRLPQKYFLGGRVSKWIGNGVKPHRTKLRKSRMPDDKIEAKSVKEVGCQTFNFNEPQRGKESLRERKRRVITADSYPVFKVPQDGDAEEHNSVQAQLSKKGEIKLKEKVANKRVQVRSKAFNRSRVKVTSQLLNVHNSQECEEGPSRSSRRIQSNGSHKDDRDSVPGIPDDGILEIEGNQAHSAKSASQIENAVETKLPRNLAKCFEKSGNDLGSQHLKDESSQTAVDDFRRCSYHGEIECKRTNSSVCGSGLEVQYDENIEENVIVRGERCTESSVPWEMVAGKQKIANDQQSIEFTIHFVSNAETIHALNNEKRQPESQTETESQLLKFGSWWKSEKCSKRCSCHDEIECNASSMDIRLVFHNVQNGVSVGNPTKSEIHQNSAKCPEKSEEGVVSQLCNYEILQKSKNGFDSDVSDSIHKDSSQNSKDGSKFCSGDDQIRCNGLLGGPLVQEVQKKFIVDQDENNQAHLTECMLLPENETQLALRPSKLSDETVVNVESQPLNSHCCQKLEENIHCSCRDEVELKGTCVGDTISPERNRKIQEGHAEAVQVQRFLKNETLQERKVEMQLGLVCPCKSEVKVESHFVTIDDSLKCDKTVRGNSDSVQTTIDEADLEKEERTQPSVDRKIPGEFKIEKEGSVQPQCSEIHHNSMQSAVFPQAKNVLINSTWKSIDRKEPKDDRIIEEVGSKPCSSEKALVQASPKKMWTLLKPGVVRLERAHEKMSRRAPYDDSINYPVIVKGGQRTTGLRTNQCSFPVQQHSSVDVRPPRKRLSKTPNRAMDHLTKIDLSDGMALKKFCELGSISLLDSDSDDENVAQPRMLEEDRASPHILSAEPEHCVLSPCKFRVEPESLKFERSLGELDPSADAVVSDNPVPSGVQALNELGFLEHGSSQFGKEHPSIWSDVLDFGDADGSGMEDTVAPRGKYYDLLPPPFEDRISGMNSEKEIEVDSIFSKVKSLKELDKTCLLTMNRSSGMEEDLVERAEQSCHDILDLNLSGKECLENDPLSNEGVQNPHFECSKTTLAENVGAGLTSLQSPGKMSLKVSRKRRSKETRGKERKHESHSMLSDILDSTPSHEGCVLKEPAIRNKYRSAVTPVNVGESECLTSLMNPGKVKTISHSQRKKEKIVKERKHKSRNYPSLGDNGTAQDEINEKIDKKRKRRSCNDSSEMETNEMIQKERKRRFLDDPCEMGDGRNAEDVSFPVPKLKAVKPFNKKCLEPEYVHENDYSNSLEAERALKELEYKSKISWLTKSVGKENNDGSARYGGGIKSEAKQLVPTSETLYRDLSAIPYVLKCNLQNRCRKCKNLNPCANANKKFKLFFTLTVGVGRRLSKPLVEAFQNEGDGSQISRSAAYIAASAAASRPTTILVPALPEVVKKIVPMYHANLLMQLVTETEELEKMAKKMINDKAIAETLQLKRELMAMRARQLESRTKPRSLQSDQTTPESEPIILQSVQPGHPLIYKSNELVAMKSKADNTYRFVRKCIVSILPKKGAQSTEEDNKKSTDVTEKQLTHSQGDKMHEVETESNAKNDVEPPSVTPSSLGERSVSSVCTENHNEPVLKKLHLDLSCNGENSTIDLNSSHGKVLGETSTPITVSTSLGLSSSLSNSQTTKSGQIKLAVRPELNVVSTRKGLTKLNTDKSGKIVSMNGQTVVMGAAVSCGKPQEDRPNPSSSAGQTAVSHVSSARVVSSVSSGKPLVISTPLNRFMVATGPGSVPFANGPRAVQPGLIYTYTPNGYVPMASGPASSLVQAHSPASSTVPKQQSSSSPLFLVLPTTTTASSQSTSFRLTPRQPVMANSVVSSAVRGLAPPPRLTTPLHLTPVSSALKIQTPPTTAFRIPLVSSASRTQTPSSLPARRAVQTPTIRRPFRQIAVTPGSVRCVNLTRIAPGSIAIGNIVQATSIVQSSRKTDGSTSSAHNQVSAAIAAQNVSAAPAPIQVSASSGPKQVPAAAAPKQVPAAPEPKQVSAAPALNQVSAALAAEQASASPPPIKVSAAATPKQLSTAPEPKKLLSAPAPQQQSALPSSNVPVTPTTVVSSPKTRTASTSTVCASTAVSQKLAEALSQKLGQKINIRSSNPGNRLISIRRKGTLDKVQTSNLIKLVFQKPQIPTSLPPP